jgi:hypothetical protein
MAARNGKVEMPPGSAKDGRHPKIVSLDDLDGLSPKTIRKLFPHATEYTGLDGSPCWLADDLLVEKEGEL